MVTKSTFIAVGVGPTTCGFCFVNIALPAIGYF